MSRIEVVEVDAQGRDADGEEFDLTAHDWAVSQGLMVNEPVLIRYPNGDIKTGNRVKITQLGLSRLASELGKSQ